MGFKAKFFAVILMLVVVFAASGRGAARAAEYVEGEALVVLRGTSQAGGLRARSAIERDDSLAARSVADAAGATATKVFSRFSITSDKVFALIKSDVKTTDQLLAELRANPDVLAAGPNRIMRTLNIPDDYDTQTPTNRWGLTKINAPAAWGWGVGTPDTWGSRSVKVAVFDTGIASGHPDFKDALNVSNLSDKSRAFFGGDANWGSDNLGHGTHVSGIIGAAQNGSGIVGVSPVTSIIMLRVIEDDAADNPNNNNNSVGNLLLAINYAAELLDNGENIKALNMSLGWYYTGASGPGDLQLDPEYIAFKEFDSRPDAPVMVVAAGNETLEVGKSHTVIYQGQTLKGVIEAPNSYMGLKNMIVVGSIASGGGASTFSNYSGKYVHLAAPGTAIYSTIPGNAYDNMDGTSMATPFVTGSAALLASNPVFASATAAQLKRVLLDTANNTVPIAAPDGNGNLCRYGLLDIGAAMSVTTVPTPGPVSGLTVHAPSWVYVGNSFYASAEIEPFDADATPAWSGSDSSVASVNASSGFVNTSKVGKVTITADTGGKSASATVEVRERSAQNPGGSDGDKQDLGCDAGVPALAALLLAGCLALKKTRA
jgi:subtilisin family serine protease